MFSNDRDSLRQFYFTSWQKYQNKQELDPLEQQIVAVIQKHSEYHSFLADDEKAKQREFLPEMAETNPFLHMGMHLGLMEQILTNRPEGIAEVYQKLMVRLGDHEAEHAMMECLAEAIWSAQKNNVPPDELAYLTCLRKL